LKSSDAANALFRPSMLFFLFPKVILPTAYHVKRRDQTELSRVVTVCPQSPRTTDLAQYKPL